jgi:hypothetical protein
MKRRAAVGFVCGPEFSSMRGNDGTAHRKAQPHAFLFVVKKGSKFVPSFPRQIASQFNALLHVTSRLTASGKSS